MNEQHFYDTKTIYYHWISAGLVFLLWIIGQNIDSFEKGDPRVIVRSVHIVLGLLLAVIFTLRVIWKLKAGAKLPTAQSGVFGKASTATHHLLYVLIGATLIVGIAAVWIRGDNIFNLLKVPAFNTNDLDLEDDVVELHELLANSLLILACAHTFIAIWHQKFIKDNLLKRMWPRLK
jgi:cytochrome b561